MSKSGTIFYLVLLALFLIALWGLTQRAHAGSRYHMEVDEVLTYAALCVPTAAIPHPCRRNRGRHARR